MEHLRDVGFPRASLDVLPRNERARRVYEAAGWRRDGDVFEVAHRGITLPHQRHVIELTTG